MKRFLMVIAIAFPLLTFAGDSLVDIKQAELSAENIDKTSIDCGGGFLKVSGEKGLKSIKVTAHIAVSNISNDQMDEFINKNVILTLDRQGRNAKLVAKENEALATSRIVYVNLTVKLPDNMELEIRSGSGSMEIGDLNGPLVIHDGAGDISVQNIDGDVSISDRSGDVSIDGVEKDVKIDHAGKGVVKISNVKGKVIRP